MRSDRGTGIGVGEATSFALSPAEVLDLALPFVHFGADRSGAQSFQSELFVGASILLLAAFGLWRRKRFAAVCGGGSHRPRLCRLPAGRGDAGEPEWGSAVPSVFRVPARGPRGL